MTVVKRTLGNKILLAIGSLDVGGAEKQMVALAGGLKREGSDCRVFVLNGHGKLRAHLETIGVPVISAWDSGAMPGPVSDTSRAQRRPSQG